jgi:S1-C subfamily serine protease
MSKLHEFSRELTSLVAQAGAFTVAVNARRRLASSGIAWGGDLVLTAAHTVKRADGITVFLPDGRELPARLAGHDAGRDLALLQVEGLDAPAVELAPAVEVGQLVLAVARSPVDRLGTSLGILSEKGGPWRTFSGARFEEHLQPDLRLYPGYAGGPLVDVEGRVIGLNTDALTRSGVLTIAAGTIAALLEGWQKGTRIGRAYLGLAMHTVQVSQAPGGVIVLYVESEGPGDRAGLLQGDVLVRFDGEEISGVDDLLVRLADRSPGDQVVLGVRRAGARIEDVTVETGRRPEVREEC